MGRSKKKGEGPRTVVDNHILAKRKGAIRDIVVQMYFAQKKGKR